MSTEASVEGLPRWPEKRSTITDRYYSLGERLCIEREWTNALRARLALAIETMNAERENILDVIGYTERAKKLGVIIAECREPSHG